MVFMKKTEFFRNLITFILFIFVSFKLGSVSAHNTSWNKAVIKIEDNRLNLTLRMVQVDLLGAVRLGEDSTVALSQEEWKEILPKIRSYVFDNTAFKVNGHPVVAGIDGEWWLEGSPSADHGETDSLMGVIEITRSWDFTESLEKFSLRFDLLENVNIPVKWVILIFPGETAAKRLYQVVKRGETAQYDFIRHAWVDGKGKPLPGGDESTVWGRMVQFVKVGFSHITLEEVFKSTKNPRIMILYLLFAIIIGAFHSLSPGHGKALIGAYIIGTRGTVADAVTLGIVTAASHTISVLILGVILLIAFNSVVPDNIASYLNVISGIIIVIIGIYLLRRRFREMRSSTHSHEHHTHSHHDHDHDHSHHAHEHHSHSHQDHSHHAHEHNLSHDDHEHQHEHTHNDHAHGHDHQHISMESIQKNSLWTNVMMGISGGMVPCPTALVVLFLAISLKKLAFGLILIVFFSFGLAATLTTLGILFAKGSKLIDRYDNNRIVERLPVVSAGIIIVLGAIIMIRALIGIV